MSASRFARILTSSFRPLPILLVFVAYFHGLGEVLASSPHHKVRNKAPQMRSQENEPTEGPEPSPPPPAVHSLSPVTPATYLAPVSVNSPAANKPATGPVKVPVVESSEEKILALAFKKLKEGDSEGGLRALGQLTREYPDNQDYGLLYRMASKRHDAQQWYRYQDWVDKKQSGKPFEPITQPLKKESNQPGRINELKRATWLILATGKYPAPEPARKVIVEPDGDDAN